MVKLACSFAVSTPYYLITDSDMFFLHPLGALDLMDQEECRPDSGVCDAKKAIAFRALNEMQPPVAKGDAQAQWISNSAATLNVRRSQPRTWSHWAYAAQTLLHICTMYLRSLALLPLSCTG